MGHAGFGRVSVLPNQLANLSPHLRNQFSYCLVPHSFNFTQLRQPGPLILGRNADERKQRKVALGRKIVYSYTPMLENLKHLYFYSAGLEVVSVGRTRIPAPAALKWVDRHGNRGVVVDSGTTFTMLPTSLYKAVSAELERKLVRVYKRADDTEVRTRLSPCYYIHGGSGSGSGVVPSLVFHFGGNSSVTLPERNYFYEYVDGGDGAYKRGRRIAMSLKIGVWAIFNPVIRSK